MATVVGRREGRALPLDVSEEPRDCERNAGATYCPRGHWRRETAMANARRMQLARLWVMGEVAARETETREEYLCTCSEVGGGAEKEEVEGRQGMRVDY
jgi:hypothetical protein